MANEISVAANLNARKGNAFASRPFSGSFTWNTARKAEFVQNIGTTAEALTIQADLTTLGWALFVNLDTINYVEIGRDSSGTFLPLVRLNAGEAALFRLAQGIAATLHARANTSAVDMECVILND